jgi:hypothetical protein
MCPIVCAFPFIVNTLDLGFPVFVSVTLSMCLVIHIFHPRLEGTKRVSTVFDTVSSWASFVCVPVSCTGVPALILRDAVPLVTLQRTCTLMSHWKKTWSTSIIRLVDNNSISAAAGRGSMPAGTDPRCSAV